VLDIKDAKIAVIGLGYVGLPLAVEFGKSRRTVGFDINETRITQLKAGHDNTLETEAADLDAAQYLQFTDTLEDLRDCNIYIVTVPTPIDDYKRPDLTALLAASHTVGQVISKGDVVIFESTVYPGATEEDCIPVVEAASGLKFNTDFFAGYSPERINPGDKTHRLPDIKKVTSGSTPDAAKFVDDLYQTIITAGTHLAPSIKVAEAAKVIENTQRDVNIALINELALIFNRLDIDTMDVLEAAQTKWNFLPFRPGLVGGHCIGVDPYYLTHKAQQVGYTPEVVLAGRRINDGMGAYVVSRVVREMINRDISVKGSRVLVMGATFKENCPDTRNSRVVDIIDECCDFGMQVDVYDPWVTAMPEVDCSIDTITCPENGTYDAIILAVGHDAFRTIGLESIQSYGKSAHVFMDVKAVFPKSQGILRI
jgi:UDP-N-acetyl-D-glucosamine/UDP-N-acetyl-D-galactosamine dehydrogenase